MALNLTTFDFALKEYYTDNKVNDLVYQDNPLLAMIPKREDFYGDLLPIPTIYGNPQGRSATFATAQSNKTNTQGIKFNLTRVSNYGLADIDNETLLASQSNKGAWLEARTTEINGVINGLSRSLGVAMYRDSGGSIGQVGSYSGGASVFTLTDIQTVTNLEVGMELVADDAEAMTSLRTGTSTITDIDRDTGIITSDAAWDTGITSFAADDFIAVEGDATNQLSGLSDWVPSSSPSATSFFGVDRTADTSRLGGNRVTGTNQPIEEALITGAARCAREGGTPDYCFISFEQYANLEKSLGSKIYYEDIKMGADIMFPSIRIHGPKGPIKVVADRNCQPNVAWMLTMKSWKLYSLGKVPRVLNTDGLSMLRLSASDGVEVRYGYYAQMGCGAPGWNARISLSSP